MKGLGNRIKELRTSRSLTLVEMAKKTGIDQATLSRIENGHMTGTLDSHMRIADVLGLRLPELYEKVLERISESGDKAARQKLESFSHSGGAIAELLTSGVLQKKMIPLLIRLKAKGHTETEEYAAGTERFVYVLAGTIELQMGKDRRTLNEGESLYFNASLPHHLKNASKTESACLSVMTPTSL